MFSDFIVKLRVKFNVRENVHFSFEIAILVRRKMLTFHILIFQNDTSTWMKKDAEGNLGVEIINFCIFVVFAVTLYEIYYAFQLL